jgi:hypothetical protein
VYFIRPDQLKVDAIGMDVPHHREINFYLDTQ